MGAFSWAVVADSRQVLNFNGYTVGGEVFSETREPCDFLYRPPYRIYFIYV